LEDTEEMKNWRLDGKLALVTGGSRGIGFAVAKALGELGASVIISARQESDLESAAHRLKLQNVKVQTVVADSTSKEGRDKLLAIVSAEKQLDILVNNSGGGLRGPFRESSHEQWIDQLERNVIAAGEMSRLFYPFLKTSSSASIVNISSLAASFFVQDLAIYGSAKAAASFLTKALAAEWGKDGIRVNAVSPWFTRTSATEKVLENSEVVNMIRERTPLGRIAEASEVAALVAFLSLPVASYISGQVILVDGAMSAKGI
jgi:Tropinone reductase 1